jgi:hypothetical protein
LFTILTTGQRDNDVTKTMGFNHRFGSSADWNSGIKVAADWQLMFISQCNDASLYQKSQSELAGELQFTRIFGITINQQYYIIVVLYHWPKIPWSISLSNLGRRRRRPGVVGDEEKQGCRVCVRCTL